MNEKGIVIDQQVDYDWIPLPCSLCKGVAHNSDNCNKNKKQPRQRRVWVQKTALPPPAPPQVFLSTQTRHTDEEGFVQATGFSKQRC